jgi:hypothetical protein
VEDTFLASFLPQMGSAAPRHFPLADQFVGHDLNCIDHLSGFAVGFSQEFILIWLASFVPSIDVL